MSTLSHIQAPSNFAYKKEQVTIHLHYTFTCDNRIFFSKTQYKDLLNHTYRLTVDVNSPIDESGLATDFIAIDALYHYKIRPLLDGQILNETLVNMNTTAENIALWIRDEFNKILKPQDDLIKVTLYESTNHGVTVTNYLHKNV